MYQTGRKIQNYRLISMLGKGGMGEVYLCEDETLGRKVAIKELNNAFTTDPNFVDRFRQEARVQASLVHLNIVSLYSFIEENGQYFMVMEYLEGQTLKELIRQIGPIPETRAINILKQIMAALKYAHDKNIVHRDIKPSNIMLGVDDSVKVMDFGIAKMVGDQGLTRTGQQLGTVSYMSPEQVKAHKDIDGRSDIYSMGVTFFEMLSGRMPYDLNTDSDFEVMNQIVNSQLPDPRAYYPHISAESVAIMKKMTVKDREQRYQNVSATIADLQNPNFYEEAAMSARNTIHFPTNPSGNTEATHNDPAPNEHIPSYFTPAMLVTLFSFLPLGIVAFINAFKAEGFLSAGYYVRAKEYSVKAKAWITAAVWVGIVFKVLLFLVFLTFDEVFEFTDEYSFMVWAIILL